MLGDDSWVIAFPRRSPNAKTRGGVLAAMPEVAGADVPLAPRLTSLAEPEPRVAGAIASGGQSEQEMGRERSDRRQATEGETRAATGAVWAEQTARSVGTYRRLVSQTAARVAPPAIVAAPIAAVRATPSATAARSEASQPVRPNARENPLLADEGNRSGAGVAPLAVACQQERAMVEPLRAADDSGSVRRIVAARDDRMGGRRAHCSDPVVIALAAGQ